DFGEGLGVLIAKLSQAFLVEMDAAFVPVDLALQFQTLLLQGSHLVLQFGKPAPQLYNLILAPQHARRPGLDFIPQVFRFRLPFSDYSLELVKLMPRELGIEML